MPPHFNVLLEEKMLVFNHCVEDCLLCKNFWLAGFCAKMSSLHLFFCLHFLCLFFFFQSSFFFLFVFYGIFAFTFSCLLLFFRSCFLQQSQKILPLKEALSCGYLPAEYGHAAKVLGQWQKPGCARRGCFGAKLSRFSAFSKTSTFRLCSKKLFWSEVELFFRVLNTSTLRGCARKGCLGFRV